MGDDAQGSGRTKNDVARQERLAQALRDNLKRRKAQIRGRAAETKPVPDRTED